MTWRTMSEWNMRGRSVKKGEKCTLKCPKGNNLFHKDQTKKTGTAQHERYSDSCYNNYEDYDYDNDHSYGEYMYG